MEAKSRFTDRADNYAKSRPAYASSLIDHIFSKVGMTIQSTVADIGAGTGIFSRQLLERGCSVVCVEPNDDMRNKAQTFLAEYEKAEFSDGNAENTKLAGNSVDFITVAQAFHWFDVEKFKAESQRILKSGGKIILIWNDRDIESDFVKEQQILYKKYCPRFKGFSEGMVKHDPRIVEYFGGEYEYAEFDNPLCYTKEQFITRSLSSSYSIREGDVEFENYLADIEKLFNKHAKDGVITVPNKSVAYWGKI